MSVLIFVLNLYARSATESQVIIIDLILLFISIHRGLLVHNLFQNYNFVNVLLFNTQQCVAMFFLISYRLRGRRAVPSCSMRFVVQWLH